MFHKNLLENKNAHESKKMSSMHKRGHGISFNAFQELSSSDAILRETQCEITDIPEIVRVRSCQATINLIIIPAK